MAPRTPAVKKAPKAASKAATKAATKAAGDDGDDGDDGDGGVAYPAPDSPELYRDLLRKRELWGEPETPGARASGDNRVDRPDRSDLSERFDLTRIQHFVSAFMAPNTPYRSLLLFHGVGNGKTCAAAQVAEAFIEANDGARPIVVLPFNLRFNFRKTLYDVEGAFAARQQRGQVVAGGAPEQWELRRRIARGQCVDGYLEGAQAIGQQDSIDTARKSVEQRVGRAYSMFGHEELGNVVMEIARRAEDQFESEDARRREREATMRAVFDGRLIIVDEAHKLLPTRDSNKQSYSMLAEVLAACRSARLLLLTATPMNDKAFEIVHLLNLMLLNEKKPTMTRQLFDPNGYDLRDSGVRQLTEAARGRVSYSASGTGPDFPAQLAPAPRPPGRGAAPPPSTAAGLDPRIAPSLLSRRQMEAYRAAVQSHGKRDNEFKKLSQICIASFDGKSHDTGEGCLRAAFRMEEGTEGMSVTYRGAQRLLGPDHLRETSPKISAVVDCAMQSDGPIFVFTDFFWMGVVPVLVALEEHGFLPVAGRPLLRGPGKPAVATRGFYVDLSKRMCVDRGRGIDEKVADANNPAKGVRVIVGGMNSAHGISFKRVREVHLLHPHWNDTLIDQVVGRATRRQSHAALPPEKRNFTVHIHCSTWGNGKNETIDEHQMRFAVRKKATIARIARILRASAVDCPLARAVEEREEGAAQEWPQVDSRGRRVERDSPRVIGRADGEDGGFVCDADKQGFRAAEGGTDSSTLREFHFRHEAGMAAWDVMHLMMALRMATFQGISEELRARGRPRGALVLALALSNLLNPFRESRWTAGTGHVLVQRGDAYFAVPARLQRSMFSVREAREGRLFSDSQRTLSFSPEEQGRRRGSFSPKGARGAEEN